MRRLISRRSVTSLLLASAAGLLLGACSSVAYPPTYSQAELRAMCERRGGWWRGDLIANYCEFQGAMLIQAP
jgi:hypothetical protein